MRYMFIRTTDDVKIANGDDSLSPHVQYISFMPDENGQKKSTRKWNIIKKFKINQRELEYFNGELVCKMIPKDHTEVFSNLDIKVIITADSNILTFQEFTEYQCNFLTLDDETGIINTINFFDLQLDKTEIFCFDAASNDYYLSTVTSAILLPLSQNNAEKDEEKKEDFRAFYDEHLNRLSRYILHCDQHTGMIINNIYVF